MKAPQRHTSTLDTPKTASPMFHEYAAVDRSMPLRGDGRQPPGPPIVQHKGRDTDYHRDLARDNVSSKQATGPRQSRPPRARPPREPPPPSFRYVSAPFIRGMRASSHPPRGDRYAREPPLGRHVYLPTSRSASSDSSAPVSEVDIDFDESVRSRSATSYDGFPHSASASRRSVRSASAQQTFEPSGDPDPEPAEPSGNPLEERPSSSASEHDDADAQRLWRLLETQRGTINNLRSEIYARRRELRDLRQESAQIDNVFMMHVRRHVFLGPTGEIAQHDEPDQPPSQADQPSQRLPRVQPDDSLLKYFNAMEDIRERQNEAEARLEDLEAQIEKEELEQDETEMRFFAHIYHEQSPHDEDQESVVWEEPGEPEEPLDRPASRTSLLGISDERPVDVHPLYTSLLSAVADQGIAKEEHEDLMLERQALLDDLELQLMRDRRRDLEGDAIIRTPYLPPVMTQEQLESLKADLSDPSGADIDRLLAKYDFSMDEDDLDFLRNYNEAEKAASLKLSRAIAEVDRLKALCIKQGAMPKHLSLIEEYTILLASGESTERLSTETRENMSFTDDQDGPSQDDRAGAEHAVLKPHALFPLLLSNPKYVLRPHTPLSSLKEAVRFNNAVDTPASQAYLQDCIKEYHIDSLLSDVDPDDKLDYINRWLLHRLRTTTMEARLSFSVFCMIAEGKPRRRQWQEKLLWFWSRDEAAKPPPTHHFERPIAPARDGLQFTGHASLDTAGEGSTDGLPSRAASVQYHHTPYDFGSLGRTAISVT